MQTFSTELQLPPRLLPVGLLSAIAAIFVVVAAALLWRRRSYVTVDLRDAEARRLSAAEWMVQGEAEEAEEMLRAAVTNLEGRAKAIAHGDLATLLIVLGRDSEAIAELQSACELAWREPGEPAETVELQIRLSRLHADAGDEGSAERVLQTREPATGGPVFDALLTEALAEFYIDRNRADEAIALLQSALAILASDEHDRAASAAVTLAYAYHCVGRSSPWSSLQALAEDLKSSAVVNLCDRLPSMLAAQRGPMLESLMEELSTQPAFEQECQQLRAVAAEIQPDE